MPVLIPLNELSIALFTHAGGENGWFCFVVRI